MTDHNILSLLWKVSYCESCGPHWVRELQRTASNGDLGEEWDGIGDDPRIIMHHHIDKFYTVMYHEYGIRRSMPPKIAGFDKVIASVEDELR